MQYPSKFSPQARARVEAEKILAYRTMDEKGKKVSSGVAIEALVRDCILRIFLVFAEELWVFGTENAWTVDQIGSAANEFLRRLTIEVQYDKGYGYVRMTSHLNGSLTQDAEQQFRQSRQWKKYEDLLLTVAKAHTNQSTESRGASDPRRTKAESRTWQSIEISFLSDERVEICSGGSRKTYNYDEFGWRRPAPSLQKRKGSTASCSPLPR